MNKTLVVLTAGLSLVSKVSLAAEEAVGDFSIHFKACDERCGAPDPHASDGPDPSSSSSPTSVQAQCAAYDLFKVEKAWSEVGVALAAPVVTFCTISCATGAWEIAHPPKSVESLAPNAGPGFSEALHFKSAAEFKSAYNRIGDKFSEGAGSMCILSGILGDVAGLAAVGDITNRGEVWTTQLAQAGLGVTITGASIDAIFLTGMIAKRGSLPLKWDTLWSCSGAALGATALALSKAGVDQADSDLKEACQTIEMHKGIVPSSPPVSKNSDWLQFFRIQEAYCQEPSFLAQVENLKSRLPKESNATTAENILTRQTPIPPELGPLGRLFGRFSNAYKIPRELEKKGLTTSRLSSLALASKSTKEFLALTGAMPMMSTEAFEIIDQGVKSGEIKWEGAGNSVFDGIHARQKESRSKPNLEGPTNISVMDSMGAILKTPALRDNFGTVVEQTESVSEIYHPQWTGNIFEIISSKISSISQRVQ